jgi:hypothetical protein
MLHDLYVYIETMQRFAGRLCPGFKALPPVGVVAREMPTVGRDTRNAHFFTEPVFTKECHWAPF